MCGAGRRLTALGAHCAETLKELLGGEAEGGGVGGEIVEEEGGGTECAVVAHSFLGHAFGAGVEGDIMAKGGKATNKGVGIHTKEVASADIVAEDGPCLKKEKITDTGIGTNVGKGRNNGTLAKGGIEDLGLWMEATGEGGATGLELLDARDAEFVLADATEDGRGERNVVHRAEDGGIVAKGVEGRGIVVNKSNGGVATVFCPKIEFTAEAACAEDKYRVRGCHGGGPDCWGEGGRGEVGRVDRRCA